MKSSRRGSSSTTAAKDSHAAVSSALNNDIKVRPDRFDSLPTKKVDVDPEESGSSGDDDDGEGDYKTAFRLAQCLGLFPVKGLTKSSKISHGGKSSVVFQPLSLRLFATVALLLVIMVLEGFGLFHIFILGAKREEFQVSKEGFIVQVESTKGGGGVLSLAPVVHYGTTVRAELTPKKCFWYVYSRLSFQLISILALIYSAFRFPRASKMWIKMESHSRGIIPRSSSRFLTIGLILLVIFSSVIQAVFGTVCSMALNFKRNDTATVEKINGFFAKYAVS